MRPFLAVLTIIFVIGLSFYLEATVWAECRTDHSFWYCVRVLS